MSDLLPLIPWKEDITLLVTKQRAQLYFHFQLFLFNWPLRKYRIAQKLLHWNFCIIYCPPVIFSLLYQFVKLLFNIPFQYFTNLLFSIPALNIIFSKRMPCFVAFTTKIKTSHSFGHGVALCSRSVCTETIESFLNFREWKFSTLH